MEKKGLQRISPFLEKKNILNVVDFTFNCFVNSLSTGPKIVSLHSNNDRVFKTAQCWIISQQRFNLIQVKWIFIETILSMPDDETVPSYSFWVDLISYNEFIGFAKNLQAKKSAKSTDQQDTAWKEVPRSTDMHFWDLFSQHKSQASWVTVDPFLALLVWQQVGLS